MVKNPPASVGDRRDSGLIPGSGRCPGVGNGNPLQCSCLKSAMDRGPWWDPAQGVSGLNVTVWLSILSVMLNGQKELIKHLIVFHSIPEAHSLHKQWENWHFWEKEDSNNSYWILWLFFLQRLRIVFDNS